MSTKGLANVIAGESSISTVGLGSGLNYRGFNVDELAEKSTFEEVLYLLLWGVLPNSLELSWVRSELHRSRLLSQSLRNILGNTCLYGRLF
jgi:2-methylcitrate synthase